MACCLFQCWNIVNWTLGNKLQGNFNWNSIIFIQENAFENVICQNGSHFLQGQMSSKSDPYPTSVTDVHYELSCFIGITMTLQWVASQITSLTIVYSTVYSGANQRKHQSSVSLAIVRGIHRWPVNSLHKGPVMWKMFPFDDIITRSVCISTVYRTVLGECTVLMWNATVLFSLLISLLVSYCIIRDTAITRMLMSIAIHFKLQIYIFWN